jgi:predicted ribosome quality control (RQC) complex YloA/Tae2 family protein
MGLSAAHIAELVTELTPLFVGLELREVQPAPPRDLLLIFHEPERGHVRRLRLSADPECARLHAQLGPVKRHDGSVDPFFAALGALLAGATLHALEQVQGDRVVRLRFRHDGRPTAELVAELTGRHANLLGLDSGGRIRARLVDPAPDSPAGKRLADGAAWSLPPGVRAGAAAGPDLTTTFPAAGEFGGELAARAPLSARVELALGGASEERFLAEARRELGRRLEQRRAALSARIAGLELRQSATAEAERVRMDAELLLAHLAKIPRGARTIELPDAFSEGSPPRSIELDPGLAPRRNAERLFARYKKLVRAQEKVPEELALARDELARVAGFVARLAAELPAELERQAVAEKLLTPPQEKPETRARPEPRKPYLSFRGLKGAEIRVGRNARDNDTLTFRESNGNDLWLHTDGSPGSHVVLVLAGRPEPDPEEVLDAAHLAVHFSPLRGTRAADVHVARRKEVHKPRKAPAGLVTLSGGKTLRVRIEEARLARLLDARRAPGEPGR